MFYALLVLLIYGMWETLAICLGHFCEKFVMGFKEMFNDLNPSNAEDTLVQSIRMQMLYSKTI